ncbi:MAG: hypothetical protein JRI25_25300 [Deltaproteobacteria bacterium]|nr:hypothetical protein [Deltaproteobacteria bacterium]MBW2257896.1 hypothetical protein [Deltaproteobacteria bacterium]
MMRHTLSGFLLAIAIALAPANARATSLAPLSEAQLTDAATYIVQGTVTSVWSEVDDRGYIWTRAAVDVSRVYKGPDDPDFLVVEAMGGEIGERRMSVPSSARFSEGERTLMFLAEIDHGRKLTPVGMFLGKYTVRRAPGEVRDHVIRYNRTTEQFDHRFLPHPPLEQRVYLDDLLEQVESRLDTGWDGKPIPGISPLKLEEINTPTRRLRR